MIKTCPNCSDEFKTGNSTTVIYCSKTCQKITKRAKAVRSFIDGKLSDRSSIRIYLKHYFGDKCEECGLSEWRGQKLSLEVDHIDGNASNNLPSNVRLLCPNCHSITDTWKAKNKGQGRKSLGLKLS